MYSGKSVNILCCYINPKLSVRALESFASFAPDVEMVNCTGDWSDRTTMESSMTRYWHELRARWKGEEDLVVLSQKLCIEAETLPTLEDCGEAISYMHGAVRYSARLQRKIPSSDIGGDYMVWHLVNERLMTLWDIHQIKTCYHF
jgi:hypothetical protein